MALKTRLEMTNGNGSHRYDKNRPRHRHRHTLLIQNLYQYDAGYMF